MRLRATVYSVPGSRRARRLSRVLTPRRPLPGLWIQPPPSTSRLGMIISSRAALLQLGGWFRVAATSPYSLVYLPNRGVQPQPVPAPGREVSSVDLVIVRQDLALRSADWPDVRRRLRNGRPTTVRPPTPRPVDRDVLPRPRSGLMLAEHAQTLQVSGPAELLLAAGDLITDAGDQLAGDREIHRRGWSWLSSLDHLVRGEGDLEFEVVGADPIFHKSRWQRIRNARAAARPRPGA